MEATGTLAPPMFPYASNVTAGTEAGTAVPFGVSRAIPVPLCGTETLPTLTYCPERQISLVAGTDEPFIHAPSMGTSIETVTQTQEDMQIFDDNAGTDTD